MNHDILQGWLKASIVQLDAPVLPAVFLFRRGIFAVCLFCFVRTVVTYSFIIRKLIAENINGSHSSTEK